MRTPKCTMLVAASLLWVGLLRAASVQVAPGEDGKERVTMENSLLRVQVNPSRGARVDGLRFKPWGAMRILRDENMHALLVDHFWQEVWPGQFWEATYEHQILAKGPAEVSVKFSCLSKGMPQMAGILLEKTITLREDDRTVYVTVRLTNTTTEGKYVGYWLQNICWLGGDKEGDRYYRPSKRGVSLALCEDHSPPDRGFVRDPQAGWTAGIDEKSGTGLVCFMDYNYLWFLYNCTSSSTIEWQDDAVAIPPGKSWETHVSVLPVSGLKSVSHASTRFLMAATFTEDKAGGRLDVKQTYVAASRPLRSVTVRTAVETLLTHRKHAAGHPKRLADLGFQPRTFTVSLPYDTQKREPAVVRLAFKGRTATGETFQESAELWYRGSRTSNQDPNSPDSSPFYTIKAPKKVKVTVKPDKIARIVKEQAQVLFLKGVFSHFYRLEAAIAKLSPRAAVKEGSAYSGGVFGAQLDHFPYGYDTLMSYDLVILSDVSAAQLGETAIDMLRDYCRHGGNLLVLGGPFAYGSGGYGKTLLNEVLPVLSRKPFDLQAVEKGATVACSSKGIAPGAKALRPGYVHQVEAKPGADVLMTCGDWPVIVRGTYGSGKVCCVTAAPLGNPSFCDGPQWQDLLAYLLKDLGVKR